VVTVTFTPATSGGLHWNGTGDCSHGQPGGFQCCGPSQSPLLLRMANASAQDGSGWTWVRTPTLPTLDATRGTLVATLPGVNASSLDQTRLRLSWEGYPSCALYNGVGGPDGGGDALVAEPWDVALDSEGTPTPVPVPACIFPCPVNGQPMDCCGPQ
jgi:hypothetical protein